ncbi:MAG: alkaline phosphatase PhoX [Geodermatophilaceae bacterium]
MYDPGTFGGTTNLEVDADGNRIREYVSLAGTDTNCAGGATPWNTWLTCEETEDVPGPENTLQKRHGYVFEVDPYIQLANRNLEADHGSGPVRPRGSGGGPPRGSALPHRRRRRAARTDLPVDPPRSALLLGRGLAAPARSEGWSAGSAAGIHTRWSVRP